MFSKCWNKMWSRCISLPFVALYWVRYGTRHSNRHFLGVFQSQVACHLASALTSQWLWLELRSSLFLHALMLAVWFGLLWCWKWYKSSVYVRTMVTSEYHSCAIAYRGLVFICCLLDTCLTLEVYAPGSQGALLNVVMRPSASPQWHPSPISASPFFQTIDHCYLWFDMCWQCCGKIPFDTVFQMMVFFLPACISCWMVRLLFAEYFLFSNCMSPGCWESVKTVASWKY